MAIQTVLMGLLPLISQEVKLIGDLNNYFNFDHNIFLLHSSTDFNQFMGSGNFSQSLCVFEGFHDNETRLECVTEIKTKNNFMIVVPESSTFDLNLNLLKHVKEIQRIDTNMKIGIFFPHVTSMEDLQKLFQWCKEQLIIYLFATTYSHLVVIDETSLEMFSNVFTFHPFMPFEHSINVAGIGKYKDFFPSLNFNFHQHELRITSFHTDIDEVLWQTVFRMMNASFTAKNVDIENETEYFMYGFDVNPTLIEASPETLILVYPMLSLSDLIIVPEAQPFAGFAAYLRTLTSDTFFGYCSGAIAAIVLLLTACRYIKQKKILIFRSLMDVLNLLINDNSYINYQRLSSAEIFLIVPLTFVGFVFVNGILSNLQSYVTRPVLQPQIKTVESIYSSSFNITTLGKRGKITLIETFTNLINHSDWDSRINALDINDYFKQILEFDTSTLYVLGHPDVNLLLNAQKRLNIRGFYNTGMQVSSLLCVYNVNETFLFFERLNEIIHWTHSSGLYHRWFSVFFAKQEKIVVAKNQERLNNLKEPVVDGLEFPIIIIYGWIGSAIVFIIEIIWKNGNFSWIFKLKERIKSVKKEMERNFSINIET